MRRPCADREEKRVTHGRDMCGRSSAMRYVTKASSMSTGRKPEGDRAMTNAERRARHPARHAAAPPHTADDIPSEPPSRSPQPTPEVAGCGGRVARLTGRIRRLGHSDAPKAYATAPRPRHSKPWSTSISMLSQTSTRRADTDATEKGTMKHHKALASYNPNQRRRSYIRSVLASPLPSSAGTVAFTSSMILSLR